MTPHFKTIRDALSVLDSMTSSRGDDKFVWTAQEALSQLQEDYTELKAENVEFERLLAKCMKEREELVDGLRGVVSYANRLHKRHNPYEDEPKSLDKAEALLEKLRGGK